MINAGSDGQYVDVTAPLFTRDAVALRLLARPRWQRRVLAWAVPMAALVLTGMHAGSVGPTICTVQAPCRPDPLSAVYIGLLGSAAIAGLVYPRLATWFAGGFFISMIGSERLLGAELVSPAWLYLVDLAFVGLCALLAGVSRDRRPTDRAMQFLTGVERRRPPAAVDLPRPGQGWRLVGGLLVLPVAACVVWGWYAQRQADTQQEAARRVVAEVIAHPDEFTVQVRLAGETDTIGVFDARNYPVGGQMELLVDGHGLRQPVSEPYDATGWYCLGILLAGLAAALRARGVQQGYGPRRLFDEAQPVTEVSVLPGIGIVGVYAGDARPGEPAVFEIRTHSVVTHEDDEDRIQMTALEPRLQPASLYGIPTPGHWCTVVVDGEPLVPTRPLSSKRVTAPPYGYGVLDEMSGISGGPDPTGEATAQSPPRISDLQLRAEEVETLRAVDREATPHQVRFHVRSPVGGYMTAATAPAAVFSAVRLFPAMSFAVAMLIAGALLALSCVFAWRFLMRPRIAWNGRGLAVVGGFGEKRVEWNMVKDIQHDRDSVTIHTGYGGLVVGAGPMLWVFGRRDRSALELSNALRHARNAARTEGTGPTMPLAAVVGPVLESSVDGLPHLDRPRAPIGLWALWLVCTPLLAWLLQLYSAS